MWCHCSDAPGLEAALGPGEPLLTELSRTGGKAAALAQGLRASERCRSSHPHNSASRLSVGRCSANAAGSSAVLQALSMHL